MRRTLSLVALATTSLIVLAFFVPLATLVASQAESRALADGEQVAESVATAIAVVDALDALDATDSGASVSAQVALAAAGAEDVSVFLPDGEVIGAAVDPGPNLNRARTGSAITARTDDGAEILIPVVTGEGTLVVRAFVSNEELRSGVATARVILAGLGIFLISAAMFVADRLGRTVVGPARRLAAAAHDLGEGDLDVRIDPDGPVELVEVGEAFNVLATRLAALLAAERESVADLSHRLRTPLAALRLQAESLAGPEAAALQADVDRLEREVDRLIDDARRPMREEAVGRPADLAAVASQRFAFWDVLAREQGRTARLRVPDHPAPVDCVTSELGAAIDALIGNVFAHTGAGVGFAVEVVPGERRLIIEDDGPGFVAPRRSLLRGESGGGSTGLGLDIVRRVAERAGGGLEVGRSESGGARVEVEFGSPPRE
ncbi:MAG: HAMP domain-containing histidine kinase [Acidimicrobiia bacterium]|nr:HAMP domain-containing histidine kinase [Acidimicrobiia bacterium]